MNVNRYGVNMGRTALELPGPLGLAVSSEIRAELGRRNQSGRWLAQEAGISQNRLASRLRDEASLTLSEVELVCEVFGFDAASFIARAWEIASSALATVRTPGDPERDADTESTAVTATKRSDSAQVPARRAHASSPVRALRGGGSRSPHRGESR
jgi:transcriptional regulator with XRE-family HTH domain